MRILLLGATGLVGGAVLPALLAAGHAVTAPARDTAAAERRWPEARWLRQDLAHLTDPEDWAPLLAGIDAVVNCAGALQDGPRDDVAAVQRDAPVALFAACARLGIGRIVQVSAVGAAPEAEGAFLRTKGEADAVLAAQPGPWTILRPGLVLAPQAYGGTALLRALSACPLAIPLPLADTRIQTVHVEDVAAAILAALEGRLPPRLACDLVEPHSHTLAEVVTAMRAWQGFAPAPTLRVPTWTCAPVVAAADALGRLGWRSALRRTAWDQLCRGVTGDAATWTAAGDRPLRSLDQSLRDLPSTVQERWFARLHLLKPAVLGGLAAFWIASGLLGLAGFDAATAVLTSRGLSESHGALAVATGSVLDVALGLALLVRRSARPAALGMVVTGLGYLAAASALTPDLWLDPLGPLVKIVPATLLALVALALLEER